MVSHILKSQQFSKEFLFELCRIAKYMKQNEFAVSDELRGKIIAMLFYEPSTRTRFSFESAALRLGAQKITTENAKDFSSASKGETLEDSIRVTSAYSDFIVLRHSEEDSAIRASTVSSVPIINAGAGKGQHPTQALLDVYTIYEAYGRLTNLHVAVVGDLLRGRTVNSLVYILSQFEGNTFSFVSPDNSRIKVKMKEHLDEHGVSYSETTELNDALPKADVVYMTRVQKERFDDPAEYESAKSACILDTTNIDLLKKDSIIMHPLPRVDEISPEIDSDPRARYFEQASNGLYVRMALLKMLNDKTELLNENTIV